MTREEALDSIKANIENKNLIKHMLATEAIMRALARRFGEDEEEWGLTGLLHDIDMELTWPGSLAPARRWLTPFCVIIKPTAFPWRLGWIKLCVVPIH